MRESDFDIPKYAQINEVALSRDMTRYGNMDECGIGTDCKPTKNSLRTLAPVVYICVPSSVFSENSLFF